MKGIYFFTAIIAFFLTCLNIVGYSQEAERKADSLNILFKNEIKLKNIDKAKSLLVEIANIYEYDGDWNNYDKVVQQMLDLADTYDDIEYKAECYNKLGISNCIRGKNTEALVFFTKALEINIQNNDTISISNSYENMALVYKDMAKYDYAIDYQVKSIRIREKVNYPRLVNNYVSLSTLYGLMNDTINQFKYLIKAKSTLEKNEVKDNSQLAIIHNEIAGYYNAIGNMDSALVHYQKVAYYAEIEGWKRGIAVGYGNIAEVYFSKGDIANSIKMHKKVLDLSIEIDDGMSIAEEFGYLAVLYYKKGELDSAIYFANESLLKTKECDLLKERLNAYKVLSNAYKEKGEYKTSLEYYKKYHVLNDTVFNLEKQNTIAKIETQYETEKKEQQIELLSTENELKNQRIKFGVVTISGLLLLIVAIISLMIIRRRNAQLAHDDLKQKLFRSQMNPHFIFNALGSIQNYMYKNETTKAARFLGNFASLSRSILKYSDENTIDLLSEIEMLKNYIELEKMRMPGVFDYEIIIDNDLETEFIQIAPMMIQPFVENAIKHGFCDKKKGGMLKITFVDKKDLLEVVITDNGIGINNSGKQNSKKHESMSTKIFYDRMKYLKKKNKHIPDIEIKDRTDEEASGTKVVLYLPILN